MSKKNKYHSNWVLKVRVLRKSKDDMVWRVELRTKPVPPNPWAQQQVQDPHPFSQLGEEYFDEKTGKKDAVANGVFEHYVANNEVTRALLNMIQSPKALEEGSGSTDWRWYRMMLVTMLDSLWD
jgi:hypothetical protein